MMKICYYWILFFRNWSQSIKPELLGFILQHSLLYQSRNIWFILLNAGILILSPKIFRTLLNNCCSVENLFIGQEYWSCHIFGVDSDSKLSYLSDLLSNLSQTLDFKGIGRETWCQEIACLWVVLSLVGYRGVLLCYGGVFLFACLLLFLF